MHDYAELIGKRIVLTIGSEVSYAGVVRSVERINNREGIFVEIDTDSGFAVWCPLDFIKDILVIPIPEDMMV